MKVVILAGGFGTRLSEYTDIVPKPMVEIGGKPIIWHIMEHYASYGYNEFILALGYKAEVFKEYFFNRKYMSSDFTINLSTGDLHFENEVKTPWKATLVDTGHHTMTGGRIARLRNFFAKGEDFLVTYGDGLANVDINKVLRVHKDSNAMVTVTAVRPAARFGEIKIGKNGFVDEFREKPNVDSGWINGGFFVINETFLNFIQGDSSILEKEPLERAALENKLAAYKHYGFWKCMDTRRDRDEFQELCKLEKPPWKDSV